VIGVATIMTSADARRRKTISGEFLCLSSSREQQRFKHTFVSRISSPAVVVTQATSPAGNRRFIA
jgi:hypothetical protein